MPVTRRTPRERFKPGDRVQVVNPKPTGMRGVVLEAHGLHMKVRWDDGEEGLPRTDLLDLERSDDE